jgi:hypothetical protein
MSYAEDSVLLAGDVLAPMVDCLRQASRRVGLSFTPGESEQEWQMLEKTQ